MQTFSTMLLAAMLFAAPGIASTAEYSIAELPFGSVNDRTSYSLTNAGVVALAAPPNSGYGFYGLAANAAGDMVGYERGADGLSRAAISTSSGTRYLLPQAHFNSFARDINAYGDVIVGYEDHLTLNAGLIAGGQLQRLPALSDTFDEVQWEIPYTPAASATALNDSGQVVGLSQNAAVQTHAVMWRDGQIIDLHGSYGTGSRASDINNAGQIVINAGPSGNLDRAGVWSNGSITYLDRVSGGATHGAAINDTGAVAGWAAQANGEHHATLWQDGMVFDLNALLLGAPGALDYLDAAYGINDLGQIIASGRNANGDLRDYLLTPVPEPGEWALLLCGLAIVWMRRRACTAQVRSCRPRGSLPHRLGS